MVVAPLISAALLALGSVAGAVPAENAHDIAPVVLQAEAKRTNVYNLRGKIVFTLFTESLCDSSQELCAYSYGRSGIIYVNLTHTTCGGAVPVPGTSTYKAWAGPRFLGTIIKRDRGHADTYSRTGRKSGYAIGPNPVRAAAVHMIWPAGRC
jgi:hypothetical protein